MAYGHIFDYISPDVLWRSIKRNLGHIPEADKRTKFKDNFSNSNRELVRMANIASSLIVRVAGLSGATAVAMGAYGTHGFYPRKDVPDELKDVYRTANYYHFLHTLALLAVPLTRRPALVGSMIASGMIIFCGTCYYHALTGNPSVKRFTPYGGMLLIFGWLSMLI